MLHRKNALFYRTLNGAEVGDFFMSLIDTCELNGADSFQYLTELQDGEVRPTHRQATRPKRHWRTRKDCFATVWPTVRGWLEAEPERTAKELFERLQLQNIGTFPDSQLRTLQRRVKAWRSEMARELVYAESSFTISTPQRT